MKTFEVGFLVFIVGWYIAVCVAASGYDDKKERVSGPKRLLNFFRLFP
jgi:hypothetical protein